MEDEHGGFALTYLRIEPFREVAMFDEAEVSVLVSVSRKPIALGMLGLCQPEVIPLLPDHHLPEIAATGESGRHGTPLY